MRLDHLLYVGPDLRELTRTLSEVSGGGVVAGGTHPGQGTHNALVGLGPDSYLELMAPDPEQADGVTGVGVTGGGGTTVPDPGPPGVRAGTTPPGTFLRSIAYASTPQVFTWCAKVVDSGSFVTGARELGLSVTTYPGSRLTPDGATLSWELIVVGGHGLGGVVPFFIDWRDSPHPAARLHDPSREPELTLVGLELSHPDPEALTALLAALSAAALGEAAGAGALGRQGAPEAASSVVSIQESPRRGLRAMFTGRRGPFELSGAGGQLLTTPVSD